MPTFKILEGFSQRFAEWLSDCQTIVNNYHRENFLKLPPVYLYHTGGLRYAKIESFQDRTHHTAWAFVDVTNGDILKPKTFKQPAKHPRGNIFDTSGGLSRIGPYGPAYLDSEPLGMKPEYLPNRE